VRVSRNAAGFGSSSELPAARFDRGIDQGMVVMMTRSIGGYHAAIFSFFF
jgi:hypothetical protein